MFQNGVKMTIISDLRHIMRVNDLQTSKCKFINIMILKARITKMCTIKTWHNILRHTDVEGQLRLLKVVMVH